MRRSPMIALPVLAFVTCCLLSAGCYMPKTPTPRLGQTAARDATSQAQGTEPEGVQPGVLRVPPSPTALPSFPTPGTPGAVSTPAPPTPIPVTPGIAPSPAPSRLP
jgi:hypothetical protein